MSLSRPAAASPSAERTGIVAFVLGTCGLLGEGRGQRAADHERDDLLFRNIGDREAADVRAVSQHGQVVAEAPNLLHPVGDEDRGDAPLPQPLDQPLQPFHILGGKRRGRLVQQQDPGLARDRTGNLDPLLGGKVECRDLHAGVDIVEAHVPKHLAHELFRAPPAHLPEQPRGLVGQQHVLRDREVLDQRDFLIGGLDAAAVRGPGTAQPCTLAEEGDIAGVRPDQAAENLDQRGLAGAVLAQQRVHVAGPDGQRHIIQGNRGAEMLS